MTSLHLPDRTRQEPAPVVVNGTEIPLADITREIQYHPADTPEQAWASAARALVVRSLLLAAASSQGLQPDPVASGNEQRETDEESLIRQVIERNVCTPRPDEETCRRFYAANTHRFRSAAIYEASHILLSAPKSDSEAYEACRARARELCSHLQNAPEDFESFATEFSTCSSASLGGNLGQISTGQTTPEFEQALENMEPGDLTSEPVASRYGFHIIKLLRRIDGEQLPFDAVKSRVATYLGERVQRMATAQFIARLVSAAEVSGVSMPSAQDMRVF